MHLRCTKKGVKYEWLLWGIGRLSDKNRQSKGHQGLAFHMGCCDARLAVGEATTNYPTNRTWTERRSTYVGSGHE